MKKNIACFFLFLSIMATVAGCAPSANAPDNQTTAVQEENSVSEPVVKDDTLRVVLQSGGRTLDPSAATDGISAIFVNAAYDQLVSFGTTTKDGLLVADPETIVPSLAKSWEMSEDGLEYTFYLDETAFFANGDPVTAKAVIFSLERVKNSPTSSFLFALSNISAMEEIDDHTVRFTLDKTCPILFELLQMHILSIVNPNELAGIDNAEEYLTTNTAGSGAYIIDKWEASSEAVLTAREDYWKGAAPNSKVHVQFVPESATRVLLAEKEDVDIAMNIPPKDLTVLEANDKLNVNVYESNKVTYFAMNNTLEPFADANVREAMNYVMPKDSMVEHILYGKAASLSYVVPSAMPGYLKDPAPVYDYDLDKAKKLLAEAGYEDGFSFSVAVNNSDPSGLDTAVLIQAELAKLNITVTIDQLEYSQYIELIRSENMQTAICSYTAFVNDPGYFFGNTLHSKGEYNYARYSNLDVDALWEKAEASTDKDERLDYYAQAQDIVFADAPWAMLFESRNVVVLNQSVSSYLHYPDGALRFYQIEKTVE